MREIRHACEVAQRLIAALDDAISNARDLGGPMAALDAQSLFAAASRRNECNAVTAGLVGELGEAVRATAHALGWQELTVARLKIELPEEGSRLEGLLANVRRRASTLHQIDATNRARGNRALAWMRILIAGHTGQTPTTAYDRRGGHASMPAVSTSTRTL
ncbi:MAG TPA: hypothetical protein VGF45_13405 [Polyangia bacterium]